MKKGVYVLLGLVVVAVVLAVIGAFLPKKQDQVPQDTQEIPVVLAEVNMSGGFRMVDAEYIVARRLYSNGTILQKTNKDEIGIFGELGPDKLAAYQAALEKYNGAADLGAAKPEESCPSAADGIDYSFIFPTKSQDAVSNCKYELDLTHPLLAPLVEENS